MIRVDLVLFAPMAGLKEMSQSFKVVDLFAGPGGLAEGFASYKPEGQPVFDIGLSVEMDETAFKTLRLRSFFRQFNGAAPREYYDYIRGAGDFGRLTRRFEAQWAAACDETMQLTLGSPDAEAKLPSRLAELRAESGDRLIVTGGPPCQAYSLVGRARNRGIQHYRAEDDHRFYLYREYIRVVERLKPVAFVMENVKGLLSARADGCRIYDRVVAGLSSAGGNDSYRIVPLTVSSRRNGQEYLIRAEDYGVPQTRHRVILVGLRSDLACDRDLTAFALQTRAVPTTVSDAIAGMPRLRSGLTRQRDTSFGKWRETAAAAFRYAAATTRGQAQLKEVGRKLSQYALELERQSELPMESAGLAPVLNKELSDWLIDPLLEGLPNHSARGHMESDLARYAFCATYAEVFGRSPKTKHFPEALAPSHRSWRSGKFADRFRVQHFDAPAKTITSHIAKDGHYFIHPDPLQCRSLTVREAARLQTFPDNYYFEGGRTEQFVQVGNAVPPLLAHQIAERLHTVLTGRERCSRLSDRQRMLAA